MLKWLVILGLLATTTNIVAQVPRQKREQQRESQYEAKQSGPLLPSAALQKENWSRNKKDSGPPTRRWMEAIAPATWSNWALFWAASLAAFLAWKTLRAIQKQASQMEAQLKEMQKVSEIENRTLILQYRPKVVVRNVRAEQFSFKLGEPWECEVRFQVVNTGGSPARIAVGSYMVLMSAIAHDLGNLETKWGDQGQISEAILKPGQEMWIQDCLPAGVAFDLHWENFNQGVPVEPRRYLYFFGTIYYTDDLNIPRSTGIFREFDPKTRRFEPKKDSEQEYAD